MNYKEYWWKCTKDVLHSLLLYLMVIGVIALAVGFCALIVFLAIKYAEYFVPIYGAVVSIVIIAVTIFGGFGIILLIFNYRHYKKYVKDGVKK